MTQSTLADDTLTGSSLAGSELAGGGTVGRRLPPKVAFSLQASLVVSFLAASSAPTPLYAVYQASWGFSPITTTVIFGVYALAVLAALLTVGKLSDHVGRRPVLITAIAMQAVTMLVFTNASGVAELMLGRVIQGLATGAAVGAIGAGLLDLDKAKGTITNAIAPMLGTGTGGIVSGLFIQYLPAPVHLVYDVLFGVFIAQGIGVLLMAETSARKPGALASMRPQFGVPQRVRRPMVHVAPVLVAVWALAGFYGSVGPAVVRVVSGSNSLVLGGLALFVLAGGGAVTVMLLRNADARLVMLIGIGSLIVGVGVTLLAISAAATVLFFVGAAIAGVGFGAGFQGAIRTVVPLAAPHERSGLLSTVYVISYFALGLPAVIGGFLVVHGGGLLPTAREYGVAIMVLAALALLGVVRPDRQPAAAPPTEPGVIGAR
jgi:predicted MFS family arabinose efflux permease